ncbi:MAG: hypothetical protein ACE5FO_00795 [Parvularculaceae bacterium]
MRIYYAIAAAVAASIGAGAALAGELADQCTVLLESEGRDASGCSCLEETVLADPALQEEFEALGEIADKDERWSEASDAAKDAMASCIPDRG